MINLYLIVVYIVCCFNCGVTMEFPVVVHFAAYQMKLRLLEVVCFFVERSICEGVGCSV